MLQTLHRAALNYERLLNPNVEPERELSESLAALGRLDVTTAYPFLLRCYDDFVAGRLSADEFSSVVRVIENYVVRRFVCFIPTNQFNKIFPGLYNQIRREAHPSILAGVKSILAGRGYPKDVEFRKALVENSLYGSGDRQAKIRFILERVERHLAGKEPPRLETVSVEHVMPQTLTDFWRDHLGEDWETAHALWLHTLGNLTLTGYNSEMSNDDFAAKRQRLIGGTLHLNKLFAKFDSWRAADIKARAEASGRAHPFDLAVLRRRATPGVGLAAKGPPTDRIEDLGEDVCRRPRGGTCSKTRLMRSSRSTQTPMAR